MRVVLEITSPPAAGRKIVLVAGQILKVGRTEWADFTIPDDGHMSGVHFSLETAGGVCYLTDLGSSNGTTVNKQRVVEKVALENGDVIEAGETCFALHVDSGTIRTGAAAGTPTLAGFAGSATATRAGLAAVDDLPPLAAAKDGRPGATYTVETCDTGLTLCRGDVEGIQPHDLAARLSRVLPAYLIVDYNKLGELPPAEQTSEEKETTEQTADEKAPAERPSPDYLFDWLPDAAKAMASPVVLAAVESPGWAELVEEGWGNDAVVCLFTRQNKDDLLHQLRNVCRGRAAGDKRAGDDDRAKDSAKPAGGSMVGFCWPSVMAPILAHYKVDFVRRLFENIEAVLVELPDLPITWQLYGDAELPSMLDQFGLTREEDEADQ